jgi:signal peptidase I
VLKRVLAVVAIAAAVVVAGGAVAYAIAHRHLKRERVPSGSMEPAIKVGEVVTMDTAAYAHHPPATGDIVILHPPSGADEGRCGVKRPSGQMCARPTAGRSDVLFVKRIVAGPRDRVAIKHGRVIRNGAGVAEPYARSCGGEGCDVPQPIVVAAGDYIVLGDNRGASDDSRFWGPVPRGWIVGQVERCSALGLHCSPRR